MSDLLWPGDHHAGDILTDAAFLDAMLRVEAAWTTALVKAGVAPQPAALSIENVRGLVGEGDAEQISIDAESGGNPVIPLVRALRDGLGSSDAASWLHRGLTSQDVVDTALMVCVAEAFVAITGELDRQIAILAQHAAAHRETPMVARTLTQQAVPLTFGLKAALWLRGVLDAREQVDALRFPVQLGGAAGTSAAVVELAGAGVDPGHLVAETATVAARELGLEPATPWHSVRTAVTRIGDAAVGCTDAWGHIANDVLTLSRPEIGELTEGAGGSSSTMPHKANPVLSVMIRRAAISTPQLGATLHLAAADSVEERTPGGWHAEWEALRSLIRRSVVAARQTTRLVEDLRVHTDRMAGNLAAAGEAVRSEQASMATIAGHAPGGEYLGATGYYIDTQLERARAMTATLSSSTGEGR